jgi:hypothetical protein
MGKRVDLVGQKFGRLIVIKYEKNDKSNNAIWKCRCDCNNITFVLGYSLRSGNTQSCGCLRKEKMTKHGLSYNPLYNIWKQIIQRCNNKKCKRYKDWGGRGITVCDEWRNDFMPFYNWAIANGWKKGLYIDRIDNDGNYEPSNCRWVTPRKSASHTRRASKHGTCIEKTKSGKYRVRCYYKGKKLDLGTFINKKDAQKSYNDFSTRIAN